MALLGKCHRTIKCRKPLKTRAKRNLPIRKPLQESPSTLAEQLRKVRVTIGLTQKEIAKKLGVGHSTVKFWEQGRSKPNSKIRELVEGFLIGAPAERNQSIET